MTTPFLKCAEEAALAGAEVLLKYWGKLESVERKSSASDLVTIADKQSEEAILKVIYAYFPDHSILAEESGLKVPAKSPYQWVIDPLDGTTNYTHSHPMISISIGLTYEGRPICGVVYNPIHKEFFSAEAGKGAYLNGRKIAVSGTQELENSLMATGFAYDRQKTPETNYKEFTYFTQITQGVRRGGSAALDLAYVAAGRLDGYWERGLQPWDIAAGALLVEEAGGKVTNYDQSPLDLYSGKILATNALIHPLVSDELMKLSRS